jgi:hypothetical protein
MRRWFAGAARPALFLAAGLVGGAAAVAVASVPSSSGVISACLEITTDQSGRTVPVSTGPNLRVIDTDAGQSCRTTTAVGAGPQTLEEPISWNQSGPQGPQGPSGAAGATGATGPKGSSAGTLASVLVQPPVTSTTPIGTVTIPLPTGGGKTERVALQVAGWSIQSGPTTYDKTTTTAATGKGNMLLPIDGIAGESLADSKAQQIEIRLVQVAGSGRVIPSVTLSVRDMSTGMATGKRSPRLLRIKLTQVHIGEIAYDSKTTKGKGQPPVKETLTLNYNSFSVS